MVKPTCTQSESPTKDGLDTNSSSSKYKGVRKRKWGKWVSEVRLPNSRERIWLGSYDSAEKAARAFDAAQYCLRGHDAKFNFPENPPNIVGGRSLSPPEIQAVASRFAKEVVEAPGTTTPGNNNNDNTIINDCSNSNNVGTTTGPYTPSSSVSVSDGGAATQVDSNHEMMDWSSFLSMLDTNEGMSEYSFYSGLDHLPGDQFYPPPILGPPPIEDNMDDDQNGGADNGFSQSSFLWDF